jgi:hypothetical protein
MKIAVSSGDLFVYYILEASLMPLHALSLFSQGHTEDIGMKIQTRAVRKSEWWVSRSGRFIRGLIL